MNNEEKILALLAEMKAAQEEMKVTFEKRFDAVEERLDRVDGRMGKMEERLDELDDRSLRSAVALENTVIPRLQLLYEGQVNLQQTLAPKERVEVLEDEVITLKSTVKMIVKRLEQLEKAE